jgi:hypothetical protein
VVTTLLELMGMLLLVSAVTVAVMAWSIAAGLAVAGLGLIGMSALITWKGKR